MLWRLTLSSSVRYLCLMTAFRSAAGSCYGSATNADVYLVRSFDARAGHLRQGGDAAGNRFGGGGAASEWITRCTFSARRLSIICNDSSLSDVYYLALLSTGKVVVMTGLHWALRCSPGCCRRSSFRPIWAFCYMAIWTGVPSMSIFDPRFELRVTSSRDLTRFSSNLAFCMLVAL
jgi:hypothetical protein